MAAGPLALLCRADETAPPASLSQETSINTPRIAFSTLAFPDADLATAVSLGRSWGYAGVELRLIDGELIDPAMPAGSRARVKRTLAAAGLPAVAVDSSIRLTGEDSGPELRQFLELASDWEAPLVRVFGGALPGDGPGRRAGLEAAARVLEEAAPAAERLGVTIGVETHDAFSASAVVAELLALVDSAAVGAVWTAITRTGWASGRPMSGQSRPAHSARPGQGRPARRRPGRWLAAVLLGDGEVPVRDMLALLSAGGYQGWVSVEWEKRWQAEIAAPEVALPQHLAMLRGWVEEGS